MVVYVCSFDVINLQQNLASVKALKRPETHTHTEAGARKYAYRLIIHHLKQLNESNLRL